MQYPTVNETSSSIWKTSKLNEASAEGSDDDALIRSWKTRQDVVAYKELQKRHVGLVQAAVNKYQAAAVPRPALEAEAWKLFDEAVKAYQVGSAAKFSTFASFYLRRIDRYTKSHQNFARIPEGQAAMIGKYDRAHSQFLEEHEREPTQQDMARMIGTTKVKIKALETSRRKDLFEGGFEGDTQGKKLDEGAVQRLLEDMRPLLNPQEQSVYDHLIGYGGKRKIENNAELARVVGVSPGRVSQIKASISAKVNPHLQSRLK